MLLCRAYDETTLLFVGIQDRWPWWYVRLAPLMILFVNCPLSLGTGRLGPQSVRTKPDESTVTIRINFYPSHWPWKRSKNELGINRNRVLCTLKSRWQHEIIFLQHIIPTACNRVGLHTVDPDVCGLGFNPFLFSSRRYSVPIFMYYPKENIGNNLNFSSRSRPCFRCALVRLIVEHVSVVLDSPTANAFSKLSSANFLEL